MEREENLKKATNKALSLLSYGARSRRQLKDRLAQYGFTADIAEEAVEAMSDFGYIDDEKYAAEYVRSSVENKGYGRNRIKYDLYQRGIDGKTADAALNEYYGQADDDTDLENAVHALKKRLKGSAPEDYKEKRSAFGFLQRRGFGYDVIVKAFKEVGREINEFEEDSY